MSPAGCQQQQHEGGWGSGRAMAGPCPAPPCPPPVPPGHEDQGGSARGLLLCPCLLHTDSGQQWPGVSSLTVVMDGSDQAGFPKTRPPPPTSPHTHRRPGPLCLPPGSPAPAGRCGAHSGSGICPQGSAGHHPCTTCSQPQVQSGASPAHAQDSLLTHPLVPSILRGPTLLDATHPKNRRSCVLVTAARAVFGTAARSHPLLSGQAAVL